MAKKKFLHKYWAEVWEIDAVAREVFEGKLIWYPPVEDPEKEAVNAPDRQAGK